jgi:cell division protein FtsW
LRTKRRQYQLAEESTRRHRPDHILLVATAFLLGMGLVLLVAISPALTAQSGVGGGYYIWRQMVAMLIGFFLFFIFSKFSIETLKILRLPLIVLSTIAVVVVLAVYGIAFRWIQIGGLSFQPAELIKFTIVIVGALFLAEKVSKAEHTDTNKTLIPIAVGMSIVAFVIVILERDLGSMVVMLASMFTMMFIANVPLHKLFLVLAAVALLGGVAIASQQYRRDRLFAFMNPENDCTSTGYHACQALIAVGSGGLFGLGVGNSVQAYGYLPEASNDSIFAIYAEKFGFIGSTILIGLYGLLLYRILGIVRRAPDNASRFIVAGVFGWLSVQSIINIGAMIGLLPLKGITLPLISYGGTSLMFVLAGLGLVYRISGLTVVRRSLNQGEERRGYVKANYSTDGRRNSRPYNTASSDR